MALQLRLRFLSCWEQLPAKRVAHEGKKNYVICDRKNASDCDGYLAKFAIKKASDGDCVVVIAWCIQLWGCLLLYFVCIASAASVHKHRFSSPP